MNKSQQPINNINKQQWIEKIKKDLKGKDIDALYWNYNNEIKIDPFAHNDDLGVVPNPILRTNQNNDWEIAASFQLDTANKTNDLLLDFLAKGLQHIIIYIDNEWDVEQLLSSVHLEMITIDFVIQSIEGYPEFIKSLDAYITAKQYKKENINLGFKWDGSKPEYQKYIDTTNSIFPQSSYIHISSSETEPIKMLSELIHNAYDIIKDSNDSNIAYRIKFHIPIDSVILFEIAKIRAFKQLWTNLLSNIGIPYKSPTIIVYTNPTSLTDSDDDNLILLTVQAMIAAITGASSILLSPITENSDQFYKRVAMNIQHVMKHESKMNFVQDPVAGSYHFELLTTKLATEVWNAFLMQ